jgi:chorismatase
MEQQQLWDHLPSLAMVGLTDPLDATPSAPALGIIRYTSNFTPPSVANGQLELNLHMTRSIGSGFAEIWAAFDQVTVGEYGGISFAHDGTHLLCAGWIPPSREYTAVTRSKYTAAIDLMGELDYKTCFRMWNFIHDINSNNNDGLEVYRDFCRGRAEAFEQSGVRENELPAATGIGSLGGGIFFYLLARRSRGATHVENPQQVPAYRYPPSYGPRAPKFARATHLRSADGRGQLYVAGTAGIRGHQTMYTGDVEQQCHLALDNIAVVMSPQNLRRHHLNQGYDLSDLRNIKVYTRHSEHLPAVRRICEERFSQSSKIAYLNVDICRSDLLVEIEGMVV